MRSQHLEPGDEKIDRTATQKTREHIPPHHPPVQNPRNSLQLYLKLGMCESLFSQCTSNIFTSFISVRQELMGFRIILVRKWVMHSSHIDLQFVRIEKRLN